MNTGIDGGMNRVFAAKLPDGNTGLSEGGDGQGLSLLALSRAPGTIPSHVNPPKPKLTPEEEPVVAVPASAPATRVATATPAQQPAQSEGFFSSLARKVGLGGSETTASAPPPPAAKPKAESKPASVARATAAAPKAEPKPADTKPADTKQAAAKPAPALKPSVSDTPAAALAPTPAPATIAGAQPVVPANSFESRFGAMK